MTARLILLTIGAALIVFQLFVSPVLGVADNSDFEKLRKVTCLGPVDPATYPYFEFYEPRYAARAEYCSALSPSSAVIPLFVSHLPARLILGKDRYDLRFLGAVYAIVLLAAFWRLTALLEPAASAAVLLIFFTAVYIPLLCTFYKDTATFVCLAWCAALALTMLQSKHVGWGITAAFTLVAFLLGASKPQYLLLPFCCFPIFFCSRSGRWQKIAPAVVLTAGMIWFFTQGSPWYSAIALYDGLFYKFLPASSNPIGDLRKLGLGRIYDGYIGQHAYSAESKMQQEPYALAFGRVVNMPKILRYLLANPGVALRALPHDLDEASLERVRMKVGAREYRLGNYERGTGHAAEQQSNFLAVWSDLKFRLLARRPWLYLAWIVCLSALLLYAARLQRSLRRESIAGAVALILMLPAAFLPAFLDAVDTGRHLMLFNAIADAIAVSAFGLLLRRRRAA